MLDTLARDFRAIAPAVDFCSLRYVEESSEQLTVRQDVAEPPQLATDRGAMVTVIDKGGLGYAATSDLTTAGLRGGGGARAAARPAHGRPQRRRLRQDRAAEPPGNVRLAAGGRPCPPHATREARPAGRRGEAVPHRRAHRRLGGEPVDDTHAPGVLHGRRRRGRAGVPLPRAQHVRDGARQRRHADALARRPRQRLLPAGRARDPRRRSGSRAAAVAWREGALELLAAPNCPSGKMDVLLMPDQMMLQIHESIGHPLELDRILGDERNFAGTSFVTPRHVRLLPLRLGAPRRHLRSRRGRRNSRATAGTTTGWPPSGSTSSARASSSARWAAAISQARRQASQVWPTRAPARGTAPPIDRMANLNVEPGSATLDELIAGIDLGVMMRTNVSWSIDDSRNKFQFGCEWGRMIRGGKLAEVVRNPNYRGIIGHVLALAHRCRRRVDLRGHGHAVLRQGRAQPGDPLRARLAGLPVRERRSLRRSGLRMKAYFLELAAFVQSLAGAGEVIAVVLRGRVLGLHPLQQERGAPGHARCEQSRWTLTLIRDGRRIDATTTLAGQGAADRAQLAAMLADLRDAHRRGARRSLSSLPLHAAPARNANPRASFPTRRRSSTRCSRRGAGSTWSASMPAGPSTRDSPTPSASATGNASTTSTSSGACTTTATRR